MVVEMAFILSFAIHFCHLFEGIEHALHDFLVSIIDTRPYLEIVGTNELGFDFANVNREVFDEVGHSFTLFAGKLGLLNPFNLVVLKRTTEHRH
jgi:hypothetical protein